MVNANDFSQLIPFEQVSKILPKRVHLSTLHRWRQRGVRGVKLATVLVGGRRFVHMQDLEFFLNKINSDTPLNSAVNHLPDRIHVVRKFLDQEKI